MIKSFSRTSPIGTSSSLVSFRTQTLSTFKDIAPARSATDFLCVQSSKISPSLEQNMTEPAVEKSPRIRETVTAAASRTDTVSFPCQSAFRPLPMYFMARIAESTARTGIGKNSLTAKRRKTVEMSVSSKSRLSARGVCSGTVTLCAALSKENLASAVRTAAREFSLKRMTASMVRS